MLVALYYSHSSLLQFYKYYQDGVIFSGDLGEIKCILQIEEKLIIINKRETLYHLLKVPPLFTFALATCLSDI